MSFGSFLGGIFGKASQNPKGQTQASLNRQMQAARQAGKNFMGSSIGRGLQSLYGMQRARFEVGETIVNEEGDRVIVLGWTNYTAPGHNAVTVGFQVEHVKDKSTAFIPAHELNMWKSLKETTPLWKILNEKA